MCNVKKEKVFRRQGKEPSASAETFMGLTVCAFILFSIVGIVSCIVNIFLCSSHLLNITFFSLIALLIFGVLTVFTLDVTTSPSYTLTLEENKLVYESDSKSVALQLPCSYEKRSTTIKLRNGNTEITLDYTELEEAELLEFLKDIIY